MSPRRAPGTRPTATDRATAHVTAQLGGQLRAARAERELTQAIVGARARVSPATVHYLEAGKPLSLASYIAVARVVGLQPDFAFRPVSLDRRVRPAQDPVHAAMGERIAAQMADLGVRVAIDHPYQRYRFAGRADVIAWRTDPPALLHVENRTRFPDIRAAAGAWNAKVLWLGDELARGLGVRRWESETHVLACLWSAEVLHTLRRHPATFHALAPDPADPFTAWWSGQPPNGGRTVTLALLDPLAEGRRTPFVDLDRALSAATRPRVAGYAAAARMLAARPRTDRR